MVEVAGARLWPLSLPRPLRCLFWPLPLAGHLEALYGLRGWFDTQAYFDARRLPEEPPQPINWSIFYWADSNATLLHVLYWTSIVVLVLFTLGVCTRITSV